jgi:thymidylate kinase
MIIEFAGPSCSGKSTLVRSLDGELRRAGLVPREVRAHRTSRADVLRALRDPRLLAWCLLNPPVVRSDEAAKLLGSIALTRRVRREGALVLLDEGPVKLHQRGPLRNARAIRLMRSAIPAPDVLVIVTCEPRERLARLRREDRPHARAYSDEEILSEVSGDHFARRFAAARQVPVIEVDTSAAANPTPGLRELLDPFLRP